MRIAVICAVLVLAAACDDTGADSASAYDEAVAGLEKQDGFFDVWVDAEEGRVLAELPAPGEDGVALTAIYAQRLSAGLGSNPLGLDRGWGDSGQLVTFRVVGPKLVVAAENTRYRATADNPLEQDAVDESFADSFLWSGEIVGRGPDGAVLADISGMVSQDGLQLAGAMDEDGAGFALDAGRSMVDPGSVLTFPDNVELDSFLTFASANPGPEVRATAANPNAVTLRQHHSFVRLPGEGFEPREFDPRVGTIHTAFYDYSAPLDEAVVKRYAVRHRQTEGEPITYYIDPGAPEPVKSALIEGASWWGEAFEAAGYPGGFKVEELPEGAHPLDARYNVVQWVHRQTRGWSYGGGVVDPRTGERIKGHVILGSQRVRQDRMIFEGLAGTAKVGTGEDDDPVELALDRIRQLSAHEVGHAIGVHHNFAASAYDRQSVMDYPAPWVKARGDGTLDFSDAYDVGIGEWDKFAITWLYDDAPEGESERAFLDNLVEDAREQGLVYIADGDGRAPGTGHARTSVWDNGADAARELNNVMRVRRIALDSFAADRIQAGDPMADLREVFVPIYLYHRFQTAAAAKMIGGYDYAYAARGDGAEPPRPVGAADQRRALSAVLDTLSPQALDVDDAVLGVLAPANPDRELAGGELFENRSAPAFDLIAAAESAADITLESLLDSRRAERLAQAEGGAPDFGAVLDAADAALFTPGEEETARQTRIRHAVQGRYVSALIALDQDMAASLSVRSEARARLKRVYGRLRVADSEAAAWLADRVEAHLARPASAADPQVAGPETPPGSPIGSTR